MEKPRVLIIEDDPDGSLSVAEAIEDVGLQPVTAMTGESGVQRFREQAFDAVLSDLMLPDIDGVEVLSRLRNINSQVPVLIMTAYGSVASAVESLKSGAYDYLTKPLDLDDLQSKILRAVETRKLRGEVEQLRDAVHDRYSTRQMVAKSEAMMEILGQMESLANTDATVLVVGESGTGKEVVARALHVDGKRATGPFVAVNCGAFSETLLDSELFGHERGAFTGATQQRKGAFERAHGGTLFLDEIGDSPPSVQVKLLRVIEERQLYRLGGQSPIDVDVRLISASNRDVDELVAAGQFREDLLYRLKVVTITIPPLRERRRDIRPLVDLFVATVSREHGREITSVEPEYYKKLEAFDWPGNVRQLRNTVEVSVLMTKRPVLTADDLQLGPPRKQQDEATFPADMTFAEIEEQVLAQALQRFDGNRTLVAEKLGLSRRTIQRKIKEFNLPF